MRVLITGSRDWDERERLENVLDGFKADLKSLLLVHGDCPTGADAMAQEWADKNDVPTERHPADWSKGRSAGPERNKRMVSLGADVCLAFRGYCTSPRCNVDGQHFSHGTENATKLCVAASIMVINFLPGSGQEVQ